jgi:hypothetical protein
MEKRIPQVIDHIDQRRTGRRYGRVTANRIARGGSDTGFLYAARVLLLGTSLVGIRPVAAEVVSSGSSRVTCVSAVNSSIAWNQFCLSFPATEPPRRKISYARTEIISCVNVGRVVFAGVASEAFGRVCVASSFNVGDDRACDAIVAFLSTDAFVTDV